jgi:hypothetical protein
MTEAKKDYRTISVTNMPKKVLEAFMGGDLDWEETYAIYPGPDYYYDHCAVCGDDCIDPAHG